MFFAEVLVNGETGLGVGFALGTGGNLLAGEVGPAEFAEYFEGCAFPFSFVDE